MSVEFSAFVTAWAVLTLNLLSPGPNVLNTITTAMGSGRAAGMASALAVAPGIGTWALGMSLGVAVVFRTVAGAELALTIVAAGLLLFFAWRYLRAGLSGQIRERLAGQGGLSLLASFLRSLSINATNPKALTTWLAILGLFPTASAQAGDIAVLALGSAVMGFVVHSAYALAFSTRAAAQVYLRLAPVINIAVAIFFTGFAVKLLVAALGG